jgi:hypothetical protein
VTWPGESLEYYDAADGADLTLYGDIYFRTSDGRTIASGDVWRVWYRADWQVANRYLTDAGADVEVSWVVEVAGGRHHVARLLRRVRCRYRRHPLVAHGRVGDRRRPRVGTEHAPA